MDSFHFNKRISGMVPSASLALMSRAKEMQKTDATVIGLAGGEPDFPTPDRICMEAIRYLSSGYTHYVLGPGIPELRNAIQKKLLEDNNIRCAAEDILITPGGKNAVYLAVNALLNEGDEVMILNPAWVSYEPIVLSAGGIPVNVKLDYRQNYRITQDVLEGSVSERTRMLIINYPNNPTGRILSREEADILESFMLRHRDVVLLSDEIYEKILFDGEKTVSMASYETIRERVITVNGFSKCAAMTGWRLGYLAAEKNYFDPIYKLYQHSVSCVSGFVQKAAVVALECTAEINEMREIYEKRRNLFVSALNEIPGVHCEYPAGAFYAWVFFDIQGMSSDEICSYLMERARVVGMPGTAYGEDRVACMRFSFANNTSDVIEAAGRIKEALLELQS